MCWYYNLYSKLDLYTCKWRTQKFSVVYVLSGGEGGGKITVKYFSEQTVLQKNVLVVASINLQILRMQGEYFTSAPNHTLKYIKNHV